MNNQHRNLNHLKVVIHVASLYSCFLLLVVESDIPTLDLSNSHTGFRKGNAACNLDWSNPNISYCCCFTIKAFNWQGGFYCEPHRLLHQLTTVLANSTRTKILVIILKIIVVNPLCPRSQFESTAGMADPATNSETTI